MADDEQLKAARTSLEGLRFQGVKAVQHGERRVEYRSDDELRQTLADIDSQLGRTRRRKMFSIVHIVSDKGL